MSKIETFAQIENEFIEKVHRMVWCNVATIDTQGRPRSRILHPIWESDTGWIATGRHTLKARHIENNPHVSLAYIADVFKPVYVDCSAEWVDEQGQKERLWNLLKETPQPLGYDPGLFWKGVEDPEYGLLKLTPWRIELAHLGGVTRVWNR